LWALATSADSLTPMQAVGRSIPGAEIVNAEAYAAIAALPIDGGGQPEIDAEGAQSDLAQGKVMT
jgi:hypothetical protein